MTDQPIQSLGAYANGEIPEALTVTIKDGNGVVIDLTGFTPKIAFRVIEGSNSALGSGTITIPAPATNGKVNYAFHINDMNSTGLFQFQIWLSDGINILASEIFQYSVEQVTVKPPFV